MEGEDMLRLIEHEQSQPFDAFAASGKIPHYTKTHFYGELCRRKGIEVQRVSARNEKDEIVATALIPVSYTHLRKTRIPGNRSFSHR